jgi:ABC-2 type transport system ATP-binding protein
MIEIGHVVRRYGSFAAVDDVSFRVEPGEVLGLLGHNGAGKTTLMKMLTGYLEPTAGTIQVDGIEIGAGEQERRAIQSKIGYLPENCPVWPEMSVVEYLDFQAALHGVAPERRVAAVGAAIERTALRDRAQAPIQTLSRGYRQRVGVAQAILHEPGIVILDEPTSGLDPTQILHMRELIRDLGKNATVIVSTHILQEVEAICERVVILRSGRKVLDTRLDELQKGARLLVTIDKPEGTALPVLQKIAGVGAAKLDSTHDGRWRYVLEAGPELAPAVGAAVVQAGFALHALTPERRDLETVFAELNRADASAQAPAQASPSANEEANHVA